MLRLAHRNANEARQLFLGIVPDHDTMLMSQAIFDLLGGHVSVHSTENKVGLGWERLQEGYLLETLKQLPPLLYQRRAYVLQATGLPLVIEAVSDAQQSPTSTSNAARQQTPGNDSLQPA